MIIAVLRAAILYLLVIAGIRLMGKRQIGELEPSELVLSLLIADLAAVPMQDFGIPLLMGITPILTLLCLSAILSVLTVKSIRFRAVLCGRPSVVVAEGKVLVAGITDLTAVKYAVLETTGRVSVLPYAAAQTPTARQMGLKPKEPGLPVTVVSDGRVMEDNLALRGLGRDWLDREVRARGAASVKEVFLMTVDEVGKVYYIPQEAKS